VIDPVTGAVVRDWAARGGAPDAVTARTRRRFVVLEPGRRTSGLAVVDDAGRLRRVSFRARLERGVRAALVADPLRERAYVLPGGRRAVAVDLRRMRARSRPLRGAVPGRPAAVRDRDASWLGGGRLAMSGVDYPRGRRAGSVPAGVSVVDTASWDVRRVDANGSGAAPVGARLVAYCKRGVRGYAPDGRRLFGLLDGRAVWSVGRVGRFVYALAPPATWVIDVRTGSAVRRVPLPRELGGVIARRCPPG